MPTRSERVAATRQHIVSTAMSLFRQRGYSNVSVKDIVEQGNISRGCFYAHFKNKDNLLGEYLKTIEDAYYRHFEGKMLDSEYTRLDPLEKIYHFLVDVNQMMASFGKDFLRAYNAYTILETNILAVHNRNYFRVLDTLVAQARTQGAINPAMSNEHILQTAVALTRGITTEWSLDELAELSEHNFLFYEFCQYIASPGSTLSFSVC